MLSHQPGGKGAGRGVEEPALPAAPARAPMSRQPPRWDAGGEPAQTNQLGPMLLPMGICPVGAKGWMVPLGRAEVALSSHVVASRSPRVLPGPCHVLQTPSFCTWPAVVPWHEDAATQNAALAAPQTPGSRCQTWVRAAGLSSGKSNP